MNRKQALKKLKEDKKNRKVESDTNYFNRFIMTLGLLLIVLIAGYLIIGTFVTKTLFQPEEEKEQEEVVIDNKTIMAGEIFDQKEESYYVLVYNTKDDNKFIDNWKSNYASKEGALTVYVVDSSSALNNKFIVDKDPNTNPTGYDDLKIVSPTLIKIENKAVTEYIQGKEAIENTFKN